MLGTGRDSPEDDIAALWRSIRVSKSKAKNRQRPRPAALKQASAVVHYFRRRAYTTTKNPRWDDSNDGVGKVPNGTRRMPPAFESRDGFLRVVDLETHSFIFVILIEPVLRQVLIDYSPMEAGSNVLNRRLRATSTPCIPYAVEMGSAILVEIVGHDNQQPHGRAYSEAVELEDG